MSQRFRDIKRRARQTIHDELKEWAWYVPASGDAPVPVSVRLHLRFDALGQLISSAFAERADMSPRIIMLVAQVQPSRRGYVVTQDMGAYAVDYIHPPDDITITAEVSTATSDAVAEHGWDKTADWYGLGDPLGGTGG